MSEIVSAAPDADPARAAPRDAGELFLVFTRLAMQGFGGVLPVAQRVLVERQRWLGHDEFLELLSISQVLPGPNVVNLALIVGDRFFGGRGAAAAMAGMLLAPLATVLALTLLAAQFHGVPAVSGALRGMGMVAAGLVLATALKLLGGLRRNPLGRATCAAFTVATTLAVAGLHWPLVGVVLGLGSAAVGLSWHRITR